MACRRPSLNVLRQRPFAKTASSSLQHSTLSVNTGETEPFTIVIADIFDAPVRLGTDMRRLLPRLSESQPPRTMPTTNPISSTSPSPMALPTSLPPPILFEGPARPRSSSSLVIKPPRNMKASPHPSTRMHHTHSPIPLSSYGEDVLTHLYDGPSRITRYRYSGQKRVNDDGRKPLLAIAGIVALAAGATVLWESEEA